MISIKLDELEINDPSNGILVDDTDIWDTPEKHLYIHEFEQEDGAAVPYERWKPRDFYISGTINGSSIENWTTRLDNLKRKSSRNTVELIVQFPEGNRTYDVKVKTVKIQRQHMPDFGLYRIELFAPIPFGFGQNESIPAFRIGRAAGTALSVSNKFYTNDFNLTSTMGILPVITLQVVDISSSVSFDQVNSFISFGNEDNNKFLTLNLSPNRTHFVDLVNGNILLIDCANKILTQSGTEIYSPGVFPDWDANNPDSILTIKSNSQLAWTFVVEINFQHRYL